MHPHRVFALIFVALLPCAYAHNWLTSPIPRGGVKDNTVSPCEAVQATSKITPVTKGTALMVTWTDNHQDNNIHALGIAQFGEDGAKSDFEELYQVKSGSSSYQLPASTFANYAVGTSWTLRYTWATWDNCATLKIAAPAPAGAVSADVANVTVNPVTNKPVQSGDYIIMDKTLPVGVFNIYTDKTACKSGYTEKNKGCEAESSGGGMSGGGKAALSIFIILLVCIALVAGVSYYKKGDALYVVRPLVSKYTRTSTSPDAGRNAGNYTAYEEQL